VIGPDQVEADQLLEPGGELGRRRAGVEGLDVAEVELLADHGRRLDQGTAAGAEPVQAGQQEGVDRGRDLRSPPLGRLPGLGDQRPAATDEPQPPFLPEAVDQLLDQQREPLGPLADVGLDGRVNPAAAEQVDEQLLGLTLGQGRQGE
jgi:hypothetical protein